LSTRSKCAGTWDEVGRCIKKCAGAARRFSRWPDALGLHGRAWLMRFDSVLVRYYYWCTWYKSYKYRYGKRHETRESRGIYDLLYVGFLLSPAGGVSRVIDGRRETLTPASNCRKPAAASQWRANSPSYHIDHTHCFVPLTFWCVLWAPCLRFWLRQSWGIRRRIEQSHRYRNHAAFDLRSLYTLNFSLICSHPAVSAYLWH